MPEDKKVDVLVIGSGVGTAGSGGAFAAQLVERDDEDPDSLLQGPAADVDPNAGSFTIFGVRIDTSGVDDQPIGRAAFFAALGDGVLVKAKGQFDGVSTIAAREVQLED